MCGGIYPGVGVARESVGGGGQLRMAGSRRSHVPATPTAVLTDDWARWSVAYEGCDVTLIRLATLLVGRDDASDVVQEAVFRTVTSTRYEAVGNHQAYLVRALINTSHQKYRSDRRRAAREIKRALDPNTTERDDTRDVDVRLAVSRLSHRQRSVLYLLYWEDRTVLDVANILDISPGAVSRHAARARAKLRGVLGE